MISRIRENRPRSALAALAFVAVSSTCFDVRAQTGAAAAAESAFAIGRTRMTEGKYEEACAAFAESLRLEPATGTLYNIALCSEKLGRTASAWSAYKAVAADASSNADRARMAKEKAALLEPQLSRPLCQRHVRQPSLESCVPKGGEWISRRAETKPYSWT